MGHTTACQRCRSLRTKCRFKPDQTVCDRCERLSLVCTVTGRQLGRKPGSKNRKKRAETSGAVSNLLSSETTISRYGTVDYVSDDMLNTLANVANDPTLSLGEPSCSPRTAIDRSRFLSQHRDQARTLDIDPYLGLAKFERGLDVLLDGLLGYDITPEEERIHTRIDQARRDVQEGYDPITAGILSESEAADLFDLYWGRCHCINRVLDPTIHTLPFVRSTSALLCSIVLFTAAQCAPFSGHLNSLLDRLDAHIDFLLERVNAEGLQSMEICQRLLILMTYLKATRQHQAWQYISQGISMAIELRLDHPPRDPLYSSLAAAALKRNVERTWLALLEWDRILAFVRDRPPLITDHRLLSKTALDTWGQSGTQSSDGDRMTVALLSLREGLIRLQTSLRIAKPSITAAVQTEMNSWLKSWEDQYLDRLSTEDKRRATQLMNSSRFLLLVAMNQRDRQRDNHPDQLEAALSICQDAIPLLGDQRSISEITAGLLYFTSYAAFAAIRLSEIQRPDDRTCTLTIIATLAVGLIDRKVHHTMGSVSSLLGKRILIATRRRYQSDQGGVHDLPPTSPGVGVENLDFLSQFQWSSSEIALGLSGHFLPHMIEGDALAEPTRPDAILDWMTHT